MPSATYQLTDKDLLYYLHIPKTAGMSFTDVLKAHFKADESSFLEYIGDLVNRPPSSMDKLKAISGHHFYNIDTFTHRVPVYITMLRDPVERTISYYAFIRRIPENRSHPIVKSMSLLEFVTDKRTQHLYVNAQTRFLAADPNTVEMAKNLKHNPEEPFELFEQMQLYAPTGYHDPVLLSRAQARLQKFAFVGLAEQFDQSVELLCYTFGWPVPPAPRVLNVSPNRPAPDAIPQEVIDIIHENTRLDAALYETGKAIFTANYDQMLKDHPEKNQSTLVVETDNIAAMQRQIDFQKRHIDTLQEEKLQLEEQIRTIQKSYQNSFGWRFILRVNKVRLKLIPHGSALEKIYLKFRGQ